MERSESIFERLIKPIEGRMIGIVGRIVRDPEDAADEASCGGQGAGSIRPE